MLGSAVRLRPLLPVFKKPGSPESGFFCLQGTCFPYKRHSPTACFTRPVIPVALSSGIR